MKRTELFIAKICIFVLCFLSAPIAFSQNQSGSRIDERRLSEIKGKRHIFVEVFDTKTKEDIENLFKQQGRFEVVQNKEDAQLIFKAYLQATSNPSFGTIEINPLLPTLSEANRTGLNPVNNRVNGASRSQTIQHEYRRTTRASVSYVEGDGKQSPVWSDTTLEIIKSTQPGAGLQHSRRSGDEQLYLAKRFLKAVKKAE